MESKLPIKVALADDHTLLRNALAIIINSFENCKVIYQVSDGRELVHIAKQESPDVVLLDVNMPYMDGYDTAVWFRDNLPNVHILMLTMYDSEPLLIRLVQAGVKGFLKKDIHPSELKHAIEMVTNDKHYFSNQTKVANLLMLKTIDQTVVQKTMLTEQEVIFLKFACSEMTYKEIAMEMNLNPRAVDALRDHLFEKLDVKTRVGLALFAVRKGMVSF